MAELNFQFHNVDDFITLEGCNYLSSDPTNWKLKPVGGCFYYYSWRRGQPVWWSFDLSKLTLAQSQMGGTIWNSEKQVIGTTSWIF